MIVREQADEFVMIGQDEHARISGAFAEHWRDDLLRASGRDQRASVRLAVAEHDRAWLPADTHPLWNDRAQLPYSFTDFPAELKLVLYRHGIDAVVAMDPYAGLLCSQHYTRFAEHGDSAAATAFVASEAARRERLIDATPDFEPATFRFHVDLLRFCDHLSLYVCLNEPGASKTSEHPWYREGIPVSETLSFLTGRRFHAGECVRACWKDAETIQLSATPFALPFTFSFKQKMVERWAATEEGLSAAYENAQWMTRSIAINKEDG